MKNDMTIQVALKILERHNDWRIGKEIPMLKPELIGQAIDKAIEVLRLSIGEQSEQLSCGRNITTCVFYKDGGKCSNLEYCKDQTNLT